MSKTVSFKAFVHPELATGYEQNSTNNVDGMTYHIYGFKTSESIAEVDVTFTLPDGFDPASKALKELEEQREELRAKFQMAVNEINDRIDKLQALTNEVVA